MRFGPDTIHRNEAIRTKKYENFREIPSEIIIFHSYPESNPDNAKNKKIKIFLTIFEKTISLLQKHLRKFIKLCI